MKPSKSYRKVPYDLRPAKQVERRMIIDALGRLMNAHLPIRDYQYTGFGSVYFVDFLLMYKLVGIRRFLSVEYDRDISKRVQFNKPFSQIDIRMDPVADVIPDLSRDLQHILWLDYDDRLRRGMLEDTSAAAFQLSPGSLLLVTVDAEDSRDDASPEDRHNYFVEESGEYLPYNFELSWCTPTRLADTNLRILQNAIDSGLSPRSDVSFYPMFKFVYADGHEMVTIGGLIGNDSHGKVIDGCNWSGAPYLRRNHSESPYRIEVPRLTRKERLYLDTYMPCDDNWLPDDFEIDEEIVHAYREVHRFYPHYVEYIG